MQANVSVHETDFPLLLRAREASRHLLQCMSLLLAYPGLCAMSANLSLMEAKRTTLLGGSSSQPDPSRDRSRSLSDYVRAFRQGLAENWISALLAYGQVMNL